MSRAGITKRDVATAVSSLRASGKPTTTRVVRLEIGKGSYRTIGKLLDELGAKSSAKPSVLPSVPETVQRQFADALYNVWEAANQVAAERSDAMQVQCEQRVGTLSAQLAAESAERRRLSMQLSTVQDWGGISRPLPNSTEAPKTVKELSWQSSGPEIGHSCRLKCVGRRNYSALFSIPEVRAGPSLQTFAPSRALHLDARPEPDGRNPCAHKLHTDSNLCHERNSRST